MFGTSTKRGAPHRRGGSFATDSDQTDRMDQAETKRSSVVHRDNADTYAHVCRRKQPTELQEPGSGWNQLQKLQRPEERVVLPGRLRSIAAPPPPVGPREGRSIP